MRIGILACSKTKATSPCAAVDLYRGRTFRAAVELLRARGCERLVILSALHGAVLDDTELAPYERCLSDLDASERRAWARATNARLFNLLRPSVTDPKVLAIVPALYAPALEGLPRVERLFVGFPQGKLYQALRAELGGAHV